MAKTKKRRTAAKKKAPAKKKAAPKKRRVGYAGYRMETLKKQTKKAKQVRKKNPGMSWKQSIKNVVSGLSESLGKKMAAQIGATTKTERKRIGKEVAAIKVKIRKAQAI